MDACSSNGCGHVATDTFGVTSIPLYSLISDRRFEGRRRFEELWANVLEPRCLAETSLTQSQASDN